MNNAIGYISSDDFQKEKSIMENKQVTVEMCEVDVSELSYMYECSYWVNIAASFEKNLIKDASNYDELKKTPAYEALMDAVDKYEEHFVDGIYIGESERDPSITAILEVIDPDEYYNGYEDEDDDDEYEDDEDNDDEYDGYEDDEDNYNEYDEYENDAEYDGYEDDEDDDDMFETFFVATIFREH